MLHGLSPRNEQKQYGCQIKFSFINKRRTFISVILKLKNDVTKVSRVGLLFGFNFQYRSIYSNLKFWLTWRLILLWKWNNNYLETIQCKELLKKQQKLANLWQKRYLKNELKHSKRLDHVTDDVMSFFRSWKKLSGRTLLSCKFSLSFDSSWLSAALGLVSRLFRSCSFPS